MNRIISCAGLLCCLLLPDIGAKNGPFAQSDSPAYPASDSNVSFDSVLALPFRNADLVYPYGEEIFQYGRLWRPINGRPRANLIFIHGGCWLNAFSMNHSYALATALADENYNVWSLEYRRLGDQGGGWPGSFNDVLAGIDALAQTGVNSRLPTIVLGHSAGGHLALLAGTIRSDLDGIIGLAAITDIRAYAVGDNSCEVATPGFMNGTPAQRHADYSAANPAEQELHPESLLLYGEADTIVRPDQAELDGANTRRIDGAGHFDWTHPGTTAFQLLLGAIEDML